jgi:hypothetical protein
VRAAPDEGELFVAGDFIERVDVVKIEVAFLLGCDIYSHGFTTSCPGQRVNAAGVFVC